VQVGHRIFIEDGLLKFLCTEKNYNELRCNCTGERNTVPSAAVWGTASVTSRRVSGLRRVGLDSGGHGQFNIARASSDAGDFSGSFTSTRVPMPRFEVTRTSPP